MIVLRLRLIAVRNFIAGALLLRSLQVTKLLFYLENGRRDTNVTTILEYYTAVIRVSFRFDR